jgi:hypothetical protein
MKISILNLAVLFSLAAPAAFGMGAPKSPALGPELLQSQIGLPPAILEPLQKEIALRKTPGYFFTLFGFEGAPANLAQDSHTFAIFARVDADGKQDWSTISWLPATFIDDQKICVFDAAVLADFSPKCANVPGRVYDATQTMKWARQGKHSVAMWGPYQITQELYDLAQKRIETLNSGAFAYQADDRETRPAGTAINCLHAISDLEDAIPVGGFANTGLFQWGIEGTQSVIDHYASKGARWFVDPVKTDAYRVFRDRDWLPESLQPHPGHP